MDKPKVVEVLDEAACWELLETHEFGRLAFSVANEPDIVPINFCARYHKLYMRTANGSKLLGVTINQRIAFEMDAIDGDVAQSVILYGTCRELETTAEREFVDTLPLRPWVPTLKYHHLEITPTEIHGRRFHLGPLTDD